MKTKTVQIHWHNKQPIFSADFDPTCNERLATGGADNNVIIWQLVKKATSFEVEFRATLSRHSASVNVVRFCPSGEYLASAGDGISIKITQMA